MTRVYLDTSIYNRPLDDQTQVKIFLEAQAIVLIFQAIEVGTVELVSSSVLEYENSLNPFSQKQRLMNRYLKLAIIRQQLDESIEQRAEQLEQQGVKPIDALHVACAEATNSSYLLTCDRRLINRCRGLSLQVLNPIDFILETENDD